MTYSIYALVDPTSKKVRYVGLTQNLDQRFKQHIQRRASTWIRELLEEGLSPVLSILEASVEDLSTAREQEKQWIKRYAAMGHPLENMSHNMQALYAREEEELADQALAKRFSYLPEEKAHQMIALNKKGIAHFGHDPFEMGCSWVAATIRELQKDPKFGLTLDEVDIVKLVFRVYGENVEEG